MIMAICVSVLSGCSLITRNDAAYYGATVASISYVDGTSEKISKRELLTAYNSYGYNYYQNYGYTLKKSFETTLDSIVENRLTMKAVEKYYEDHNEELLNDGEKTYIYDQTKNALFENMQSYYEKIVGLTAGSDTENTSSDSNSRVFVEYEKQAYYQDGKIYKTSTTQTTRDSYVARYENGNVFDFEQNQFKTKMMNDLLNISGDVATTKNWKNAYNNYVSDIKKNFKYMNFKSNAEWFKFEMNRIYEILRNNYLVQRYTEIYNFNQYNSANLAGVTASDLLKAYSKKVRTDYTKYLAQPSQFETDMLDNTKDVDYILQASDVANYTPANYFYVGAIKIDVDQTDIQIEKAKLDRGEINENDYNDFVRSVFASAKAKERSLTDGELTGREVLASELENEIGLAIAEKKYINLDELSPSEILDLEDLAEADGLSLDEYVKIENEKVAQDRADVFKDYFYGYNDETTYLNADFNLVFGVKNGQVLAKDVEDYKYENKDGEKVVLNAINTLYAGGDAKVGDLTSLVKIDDAYYIFCFLGNVENAYASIDKNFEAGQRPNAIETLLKTKLNIFSNKTLFDVLYEETLSDNFSVFQNMDMDNLKATLVTKNGEGIRLYPDEFKDLYKK